MSNNVEIERRFFVANDDWKQHVIGTSKIKQGYLSIDPVVRVRIYEHQETTAALTIKGPNTNGVCSEHEYEIPVQDVKELLEQCKDQVLYKTRHVVYASGCNWEIDVFEGKLEGLVLAEIELELPDEVIDTGHSWLGKEITGDHRYANSSLTINGLPE